MGRLAQTLGRTAAGVPVPSLSIPIQFRPTTSLEKYVHHIGANNRPIPDKLPQSKMPLRQPLSQFGINRNGGSLARLRLNMTIDYELDARSGVQVRGKTLFFWRRTRVRLANVVRGLAVGILPLPSEFFVERWSAKELRRARRQWNAAATEHQNRSFA